MANYALIDNTGTVVNIIVWDGVQEYTPPDGINIIQSDTAGRGDTYNQQTGEFIRQQTIEQ